MKDLITIAVIKERKDPPDRRVALSPKLCNKLLKKYKNLRIKVEPSPIRIYSDQEYIKAGVEVTQAIDDASIFLGVKEVPCEALVPDKKYFFFSHTIKKQPHNLELLREVLKKNIELYDYEALTDEKGKRVIGFGRYAGIVGAYNGFRAWGLKFGTFNLPRAQSFSNQRFLIEALKGINLPNIKIVLTGIGRVATGAKEMLDGMGLKQVSIESYLKKTFNQAVYVQINCLNYNKRKDGLDLPRQDFFKHPYDYQSDFMRFAKTSQMYIAGHFYKEGNPFIFTRDDAKKDTFKIKVVADISCDIDGPVACTLKTSTIEDPIYGYNPLSESIDDFTKKGVIAVMAVDNLPCELPKDASEGFGEQFEAFVIPAILDGDSSGILDRSRITFNGKLTNRYKYLYDYVNGTNTL